MAQQQLVPGKPVTYTFDKDTDILLIRIGEAAQMPCYLCRAPTRMVWLLAVGDRTCGYEFWCGNCKPAKRPGIDCDV